MSDYEYGDERYDYEDVVDDESGFNPYDVELAYSISASGININYEDPRQDPRFVEVNMSIEDPKYARMFDFLAEKLRDSENVTLAEWEFVFKRHDQLNGNITKITENIAVLADGSVTHNYDTRKDALHAYIGELVAEKNPMAKAFARFAERLEANPSEHSKDQLFNWFIGLTRQGERMSITNDGKLVAYKGVKIGENDVPYSIMSGPGIIENPSGETEFIKHDVLPNRIGSTVSVQRSYVEADPKIGCGPGLHAGTYSYARAWGNGNVLQVEIDPAHIVAIPDCSGFQKLRSHRYLVVGFINDPITSGVVADSTFAWTVEDFEKWEEAGHKVGHAKGFIQRGIEIDEALEVQKHGGFTLDVEMYTDEGFSPLEALRFIREGVSVEEALEEMDEDYNDYIYYSNDDDNDDYEDDEDREVESTEPVEPVEQFSKDSQLESKETPSKGHKKKNRKRRKKGKR